LKLKKILKKDYDILPAIFILDIAAGGRPGARAAAATASAFRIRHRQLDQSQEDDRDGS